MTAEERATDERRAKEGVKSEEGRSRGRWTTGLQRLRRKRRSLRLVNGIFKVEGLRRLSWPGLLAYPPWRISKRLQTPNGSNSIFRAWYWHAPWNEFVRVLGIILLAPTLPFSRVSSMTPITQSWRAHTSSASVKLIRRAALSSSHHIVDRNDWCPFVVGCVSVGVSIRSLSEVTWSIVSLPMVMPEG